MAISVKIVRISEPVVDHPEADNMSVVTIGENKCVSAKLDDGSPRYEVGSLVVYILENAIVPEYLLRQGFWDAEKGKGLLGGSKGNRVKARNFRGVESRGIMFPVEDSSSLHVIEYTCGGRLLEHVSIEGGGPNIDELDLDVAALLDITEYTA